MISFLQFSLFKKFKRIKHFITTRNGGVSKGNYASLNLGMKSGDDHLLVTENRALLASALGIETNTLIFPDQCHTDKVGIIDDHPDNNQLKETDALVTNKKNRCLCILTADCVPVLLYDTKNNVIAAVHAGWRGTIQMIVSRTVETMMHSFASDPLNICAGIGPAISQTVYEVGEDVAQKFREIFGATSGIISMNAEIGKNHINLQLANKILLEKTGILPGNMNILNYCTFSNPDLFFSARHDGINSGRFATGIMLV